MRFSHSLNKGKNLVANKDLIISKDLIEVKDLVKDFIEIMIDVRAND